MVWPGIDGYENPFGHDFYGMWNRFEEGLAEAMDEVPGVRVALEPKPYEPRGNNVYRNTANGLLMAKDVEALLSAPQNKKTLSDGRAMVGLNPEVGHVLMGHEELAYAFASVLREGRLMHSHWNSQPLGNYDQDLDVGCWASTRCWQRCWCSNCTATMGTMASTSTRFGCPWSGRLC